MGESGTGGLGELRIPYIHQDGLYVITGYGSTVLQLPAKRAKRNDWKGQGKLAYGYNAPSPHPKQDRIACVRCFEYDPVEGSPLRGRCEIVEVSWQHRKPSIRVLFAPSPSWMVDSPTWSPDGRSIAFFLGPKQNRQSEVVIMDAKSGALSQRVPLRYGRGVTLGDNYLRWSPDGNRIIMWTTQSPEDLDTTVKFGKEIGILTCSSGEVRWLGRWVEQGSYRRWDQQISNQEDAEAVRTLFGSNELPTSEFVVVPIRSPDGRYLFSRRSRMGFGAKGWIERYDVQTRERVAIRTVWWVPFFIWME